VGTLNAFYSSVNGVLFNKNRTLLIQYPGGKAGSYTLPNSVTNIGYAAFFSSTSLTNVTIPNSVTSIGDSAFERCTSLTNATIPNSVTSIGGGGFAHCASLTGVTVPNSVASIGVYAFYTCDSLSAITVGSLNAVYSSVDGVLFNKSQTLLIQYPGGKAGSYTVPNSVTNIGSEAFSFCPSLTSVTIPNSVTSIGLAAFAACPSLSAITVDALNAVYSSVDGVLFNKSRTLLIQCPAGKAGSYTIPNNVTSIEWYGFYSCTGLTSVTIPDTVASIGGYVFYSCTNLTGVYFQGNAPDFGPFVFIGADNATLYYLPGATGWGTTYTGGLTFTGRPAVLWNPRVETSDASFGVRTNRFGFNITWASDRVLVVEACTNLANPAWTPVGTNTLTGGSSYFSDPEWTNYPARFYRLRSP
jgi:hypothetical protein